MKRNVLFQAFLSYILCLLDTDVEDHGFLLWRDTIHVTNGSCDAAKVSLDLLGILIDAMDVYSIAQR